MPALLKEITDDYVEQLQRTRDIEEIISNRIDEVLKVIALCFRKKPLSCWWFPNTQEGGVGSIMDEYDSKFPDMIQFATDDGHDFDTYYSKGNIYDYEFPSEFLYMTDEDIRNQILKEIELGKQEMINKKLKAIKSKEEKEKKKQKILNKLTKEERKILSL